MLDDCNYDSRFLFCPIATRTILKSSKNTSQQKCMQKKKRVEENPRQNNILWPFILCVYHLRVVRVQRGLDDVNILNKYNKKKSRVYICSHISSYPSGNRIKDKGRVVFCIRDC